MTIELEYVVGFNVFRSKHIALNASEPTYDDQLIEVMCTIENKQIMFDFFKCRRYVHMHEVVPFWNHTLLYLRCSVYSWAKTVMFSDV
jgi:hypothetical protein